MRRWMYLIVLAQTLLHAVTLDGRQPQVEILSDAEIFLDHNRSVTRDTIASQPFQPSHVSEIGYGYSPDFVVWVRFVLSNDTDRPLHLIFEYANPITSNLTLYRAGKSAPLMQDGLLSRPPGRHTLHPTTRLTLAPHATETYYLRATSTITTLILRLRVWQPEAFAAHEEHGRFLLGLFFGAMGIIILFNFIIYLTTRDRSYLYYVLFFASLAIHHLFYKGVASLYLTPRQVATAIGYTTFIVAAPTFFLGLFTRSVLRLPQYPRLDRLLRYGLGLFVPLTFCCWLYDLNHERNWIAVGMLLLFFGITFVALIRGNRQARFIMIGWGLLFLSGLFMHLSSAGIYDIFAPFPYYVEVSLVLEALLFSLLLSDRIKQLHQEKIASQKRWITYQKEEEKRLSTLVTDRTLELERSLSEKEILLQELNHRVKNSMQSVISFLQFQIDKTNDTKLRQTLTNLENRILAISHLYALLHSNHDILSIQAYEYFSLLLDDIQASFDDEAVSIRLDTRETLEADEAIYCGFILTEAATNAFQHAFAPGEEGTLTIELEQENHTRILRIRDNGRGYDSAQVATSLGLAIIETLATRQLGGTFHLDASDGVHILITWSPHA